MRTTINFAERTKELGKLSVAASSTHGHHRYVPMVRQLCENFKLQLIKVRLSRGLDLPYPKTKTLVVIAIIAVLVIPNSCAICSAAGATMEDDTGEMKVNNETTMVAAHFLL